MAIRRAILHRDLKISRMLTKNNQPCQTHSHHQQPHRRSDQRSHPWRGGRPFPRSPPPRPRPLPATRYGSDYPTAVCDQLFVGQLSRSTRPNQRLVSCQKSTKSQPPPQTHQMAVTGSERCGRRSTGRVTSAMLPAARWSAS